MHSVHQRIETQVRCFCTFSPAARDLVLQSSLVNPLCSAHEKIHRSEACHVAGVDDPTFYDFRSKIRQCAVSGDLSLALHTLHCMNKTIRRAYYAYDFNDLIYWYCKSNKKSFEALVKLYQAMKIAGPKPNALTFKTLINGMNSVSDLQNSVFFVNEMCKFGYPPSFFLLSKLLTKLIARRRTADSLFVLNRLLRLGYIPKENGFFPLINILCKSGRANQAFLFLSALCRRGILYQGYTLTPIIWSLCKRKKSNSALQMVFWMLKSGLKVNTCTYTALVYGFCKERRIEDALWCIKEMRRVSRTPNVFTYTSLLKHFCDNGMVKEALDVLDLMENEKCGPDVVAYNIVIRELCNQGNMSSVAVLIDTMKRKNLPCDAYTITAFCGGFIKRRDFGFCYRLILDVLSSRQDIDVAPYNVYFHCLCRLNRSRKALFMLNKMKVQGIKANSVSYNIILKGLCGEGNIREALKLLHLFTPNIRTYNTILSWGCRFKNKNVINRAIFLMEEQGTILDEKGYSILIHFAFRCKAFKLLDSLMKHRNSQRISQIIACLCRGGRFSTAYRFANCFDSLLDTDCYNALIQSALKKNDYLKVHYLLNEMLEKKLKPDSRTYTALICLLCSEGRISSAFKLMNIMRKGESVFSPTEVYNVLMKAMMRKGKLMYALCLLEDMLMEGCVFDEVTMDIVGEIDSKHWLKICPDVLHIMEHGYFVMCSLHQRKHSLIRRIRG